MKRPWVRRFAYNGRRYRSADNVTLGGDMLSTVTPKRCPPGMVPTSRGCIKPTKGPSIIQRALGALGLELPAPGAPEPLSDCGCGCKGAGTCGKGMGNIKSWKSLSGPHHHHGGGGGFLPSVAYGYGYPQTVVIEQEPSSGYTRDDDRTAREMAYVMSLPKGKRAAAYEKIFGRAAAPGVLGDVPLSTSVALLGAGVAAYLLFFRKR